jgi:hypothetical protein
VEALVETVKLLVTRPNEAFERAREKGDYVSPLAYALICGFVAAVAGALWNVLFNQAMLATLPPEMKESMGKFYSFGMLPVVVIITLAAMVIGIFIWAGLVHLSLSIVGGLANSTAGFEGTFRACCYGYTAQLANVVPMVGGLVAVVWWYVLCAIGLIKLHKASTGQAVAAVLIPLAVCCVCIGVGAALMGATIAAILSGAQH